MVINRGFKVRYKSIKFDILSGLISRDCWAVAKVYTQLSAILVSTLHSAHWQLDKFCFAFVFHDELCCLQKRNDYRMMTPLAFRMIACNLRLHWQL